MPQKSFEEQLRDKSSEFTLKPKAGLWESVSAQLEPEKKKRRAFLLPLSLGLVIVMAAVVYGVYDKNQVDPQVVAVSATREPGSVNNSKSSQEKHLSSAQTQAPLSTEKQSLVAKPAATDHAGTTSANPGSGEEVLKTEYSQVAKSVVPEKEGKKEGNTFTTPALKEQTENPEKIYIAKEDKPEHISVIDKKTESITLDLPVRQIDLLGKSSIVADSLPEMAVAVLTPVKPADTSNLIKMLPSLAGAAKRTYIEFLAGPVLSGSWVHTAPAFRDSSTFRSQAEDRKKTDRKNWNFSAGIQVGMDHKKFRFSAGLHYQVLSYQVYVMNINSRILNTGVTTTSFDYNATDSFAMVRTQSPVKGVSTYITNKFQYLGIPLSVVYKFRPLGRFNAGIGTTASPQFLLAYKGLFYQQSSGYYVKEKSAVENNIQKINLSMRADITLSYRTGPFSALVFNPYYGVSLFPAERSAINTGHVFLGFSAGFRKYF
jgi:hypothetical protein